MKSISQIYEDSPNFYNDVVKKTGSDLVDMTKKGLQQHYNTGKKIASDIGNVASDATNSAKQFINNHIDHTRKIDPNYIKPEAEKVNGLSLEAPTRAYVKPEAAKVNGLTLKMPEKPKPVTDSGLREEPGSKVGTTPSIPKSVTDSGLREEPGSKVGTTATYVEPSNVDKVLNKVHTMAKNTGATVSNASQSAGEGIKNLTANHPSITAAGQKVGDAVSSVGKSIGDHLASVNPAMALGGAGVAALGGLGYLAYKKLRNKQKAKEAVV